MPSVLYLTMNSISSGVGSSQVWEYVKRLPDLGHNVSLVSFEPPQRLVLHPARELPPGVSWSPREFNRGGRLSPVSRVLACAVEAGSAKGSIVHARSDLPALGTLLAAHDRWVWDMRAFWREQRVALGAIQAGSPTERALRLLEKQAAQRSSAIICLAEAAVPVLARRFGRDVAAKVTVIPTAVDVDRFTPAIHRGGGQRRRIMLSGTYNGFYDGAAMAQLLQSLRRRCAIEVTWVGGSTDSPWRSLLDQHVDTHIRHVDFESMPGYVAASDVGIVICRADGGTALKAAMPTKLGEFLSCGRPVVVNRGLGDMDALIEKYRCGVVVTDPSPEGLEDVAERLLELLQDPDLADRCRSCAIEHFDLEVNVQRLASAYQAIA